MISPPVDAELLAENIELHRRGYFAGNAIGPFLDEIIALCAQHQCATLLDFGCGKAELWEQRGSALDGLTVSMYDPAVEHFSSLPDQVFDAVVCVDVLEHIPSPDLPATLRAIAQRASKFIFIAVCTREGTKTLPFKNTNVHVTVQPPDWWAALVTEHCRHDGIETYLRFSE